MIPEAVELIVLVKNFFASGDVVGIFVANFSITTT